MGCFSGDFWSSSLRQTQHVNVILPDASEDFYPLVKDTVRVVYLLHGLGANADEWIRFSQIEAYAKLYNLAIVMPEVGRSFYQNTPAGQKYEHWIAAELPDLIRTWFRLPADRAHTFIAGVSMGDYGAMRIALTYPHSYAAAAALSPVCDPAHLQETRSELFLTPHELNYSFGTHRSSAAASTSPAQAADKGPSPEDTLAAIAEDATTHFTLSDLPKFFICCGNQDKLAEQTTQLANTLATLNIDARTESSDGGHNFLYWNGAIERALRYFCELPLD